MIGEININSHFWKGLRITFQGQNLLKLLSLDHQITGVMPVLQECGQLKITWQSDADTWHKEMAVLGRQCWQLYWKDANVPFNHMEGCRYKM